MLRFEWIWWRAGVCERLRTCILFAAPFVEPSRGGWSTRAGCPLVPRGVAAQFPQSSKGMRLMSWQHSRPADTMSRRRVEWVPVRTRPCLDANFYQGHMEHSIYARRNFPGHVWNGTSILVVEQQCAARELTAFSARRQRVIAQHRPDGGKGSFGCPNLGGFGERASARGRVSVTAPISPGPSGAVDRCVENPQRSRVKICGTSAGSTLSVPTARTCAGRVSSAGKIHLGVLTFAVASRASAETCAVRHQFSSGPPGVVDRRVENPH